MYPTADRKALVGTNMKTGILILLTFAALVGFASATRTAGEMAGRKELERQQARLDEAWQNGDVKTYESLLAPDFTASGPGRQVVTREQMLAKLKEERRRKGNTVPPKSVKSVRRIEDVTVKGDKGVIFVTSGVTLVAPILHGP